MKKKNIWDQIIELKSHIIDVTFWDHASGQEIILSQVSGWLEDVLEKHIVVNTWNLPGRETSEQWKDNREFFSISKSDIEQITPYKKLKTIQVTKKP